MAQHIIAIFDTSCPSGWTWVGAGQNNKFLKGASSYGGTGGTSTHTHTVDASSATTGGATTRKDTTGGDEAIGYDSHTHSVATQSSLTSGAGSSLPEYVDVVACYYNEDFI